MEKGYLKVVGAKLLHVVNETFYSIPTNGANFRYLIRLTSKASTAWYKPTKRGSGDGVSTVSPMLKSAKGWRRRRRKYDS